MLMLNAKLIQNLSSLRSSRWQKEVSFWALEFRGPRKVLRSKLFGERRNKWSKLKGFARKTFSLAKFVWTSGCPAHHICEANISHCRRQYFIAKLFHSPQANFIVWKELSHYPSSFTERERGADRAGWIFLRMVYNVY